MVSTSDLMLGPKVLDAVLEVGRAVAAGMEMPELLALVVSKAAEVGNARQAAIAFVDDRDEVLTLRAWQHLPAEVSRWRGAVGKGLLGRATSGSCDLRSVPPSERESFLDAESALAIPLVAERRPKGVLLIARQAPFSESEGRAFEALGAHFAAAIDNAWLYDRYRALNSELEAKVASRTRELDQARAQLMQQDKMASLGLLTAGVAHEINNPLAFVASNLDLLATKLARLERERQQAEGRPQDLEERVLGWRADPRWGDDVQGLFAELPGDPAERRRELEAFLAFVQESDRQEEGTPAETMASMGHFIAKTKEGVERIKGIVRDLRSFSRLDEAAFECADLHEGLEQTVSLLGHLFKGTAIALTRSYALTQRVPCHPARLNQVVVNLLVNAVHALGNRGEIRLSTYRQDDWAVIEVSDDGPGIAPEALDRIFEPYFTTKAVGEGTGLGLSLSYAIVADHGGKLEVESPPGQGATFRVMLPLDRPEEDPCPAP